MTGVPVEGAPRTPGAPGSFFGTHSIDYVNPTVPAPLNHVEPSGVMANYYVLGDGSIESADEIERIYAEQKRRARGQDEFEPASRVHAANKFKDGAFIPRADQLAKGERELDVTCHPNGGWELDPHFKRYSQRTQRYETQISRARGLDYVVRIPGEKPVKFDGCAIWDPRHPLLEAKGPGYASLLDVARRYGFFKSVRSGPASQSDRQNRAARGRPIDWHYAEAEARGFFEEAVEPRPPITLHHTRPDDRGPVDVR